MKRKHLMAFALAGMLAVANAVPAFAVDSITTDPIIVPPTPTPEPTPAPITTTVTTGNSRSERTSDRSNVVVRTINRVAGTVTTTNPALAVILDASTPLAAAPATVTAAVNPDEVQMPAGSQTNASGDTIIGDKAIGFVRGENATAGLPENVVGMINNINAGQPLETALNTSSLAGYHALTGTHAISVKNAATGEAAVGNVEMSLYVPNLVNGLDSVSILFYDNATGQWSLIPAAKIDPVTKTVTVNVTGSGTLAVVYKRQ